MKYQPPFVPGATPGAAGIHNADPDAAYVNGDPSTGSEGSYVPMQAIEHPQREIVASIVAAGLTPDHSNLDQLKQSIARHAAGGAFGGTCTGAANAYVVTKLANFEVPSAPFRGMIVVTTANHSNTAQATADVYGFGLKRLLTFAGAALSAGSIVSGRPTAWQYSDTAEGGAGAWLILPWSDARGVAAELFKIPSTGLQALGLATALANGVYTQHTSFNAPSYNKFVTSTFVNGTFTVGNDEDGYYAIDATWDTATLNASSTFNTALQIQTSRRTATQVGNQTAAAIGNVHAVSITVELRVGDTIRFYSYVNSTGTNQTIQARVGISRLGAR